MNDIEDRLRQFQPAGPPPDFRARLVDAAGGPKRGGRSRWLEWLPAAAAAAIAIVFSLLSANTRADISTRLSQDEQAHEAMGAGPETPATVEQAMDHD